MDQNLAKRLTTELQELRQLQADVVARQRRFELQQAELEANASTETTTETVTNVTNNYSAAYWTCIRATGLFLTGGNEFAPDFLAAGTQNDYCLATARGELIIGPGQQYGGIQVENSGSSVNANINFNVVQTGGGTSIFQLYVNAYAGAGDDYNAGDQNITLTIPSGTSTIYFATNGVQDSVYLRGLLFDGSQVTWIDPNA